jgi:superfamily II RNA helicase
MSQTTMLRSCDLSKPPPHIVQDYAIKYNFPLDIFQEHAISAIDQGHNVLVCAKTGSGKTLVAEYAIADALRKNKRVFYTTPIKSLSNQKFHDLKAMWPSPGQVGILTGDIKFCPDAQIIVMTTEILRNLLYKQGTSTEHVGLTASLSLVDLGVVIFDECHYINDRDRGKVWEETMILLPPSVQLVMLSATLDRPDLFASWIGELKNTPCHLIETQYRVVPLTHHILGHNNQLKPIMDSKEVFYDDVYADYLRGRLQAEKDHEAYQKKVALARRQGQEGPIAGKTRPVSFLHQLNGCIQMLNEKHLLPALVFVLSRKGCEQYAAKTEATLLDSSDSCAAANIFDFHLRHHKQNLETMPQYNTLRTLIQRGIAFHHSGVLPVLKEIIEILFTKGYIKLLYCTETFAVGINMPTKTVIFTGLQKYDDATQGMRFLRTDEYIQMAGRAGRRGKDPVGTVILLPDREPPTTSELRTILKGGKPQIQSRMDFHYDFLLKTLHAKETRWIEIQQRSYWYRQLQQGIQTEQKELETLKNQLEAIPEDKEAYEAFQEKQLLEYVVKTTSNAKRRDAQRKLDTWKEEHEGPQWVFREKNWMERKRLQAEATASMKRIELMEQNQGDVPTLLSILTTLGFINEDLTLTKKGILASEFNEGHSLLHSEFVERELHKGLTGEELCAVLACCIEEKDTDEAPTLGQLKVPEAVREAMVKLDTIVGDFTKEEDKRRVASPPNYWKLSTIWVEPIWRWLNGESASVICSEHGLFEGNFVRIVLRVANMVDEWIAVAQIREDIETLETLQGVRQQLVRDFIVPDSLYLHI